MANLYITCPSKITVGEYAEIDVTIEQSYLYEFDMCRDQMILNVYINDSHVDSIPLSMYTGDVISIGYPLSFTETGVYTLKFVVENAGTLFGCGVTVEKQCSISVVSGEGDSGVVNGGGGTNGGVVDGGGGWSIRPEYLFIAGLVVLLLMRR